MKTKTIKQQQDEKQMFLTAIRENPKVLFSSAKALKTRSLVIAHALVFGPSSASEKYNLSQKVINNFLDTYKLTPGLAEDVDNQLASILSPWQDEFNSLLEESLTWIKETIKTAPKDIQYLETVLGATERLAAMDMVQKKANEVPQFRVAQMSSFSSPQYSQEESEQEQMADYLMSENAS